MKLLQPLASQLRVSQKENRYFLLLIMRGKRASERKIAPDPVYKSVTVARLINYVMLDGKKSVAAQMVYDAIEKAAAKVKKDPMDLVDGALSNVKPNLEIRSRRVGGANYHVPMPVSESRQETLALRWIVKIARNKKGKEFSEILGDELVAAFKGEGDAVKTKIDTEKMAEANKAFAHFRW